MVKIHKVATNRRVVLFDDDMILVEPVNQFLRMQELRGRSENTIMAYARDLKCYYAFLKLKHYSMENLNLQVLGEDVEYLESDFSDIRSLFATSRRTPQTINRMLSTVSSFYKYLVQAGGVEKDPISGIVNGPRNGYKGMFYHTRRNPSGRHSIFRLKETKYHPNLLSERQIRDLYLELPTERDRILFKLLLYSGMRISEALSLKIQDIPIPDPMRSVAVLRNIKSKGKRRDIYIPELLVEELDQFILSDRAMAYSKHDYLFVAQHPCRHYSHITYSGIYSVFKHAGQRADIDFRFHDIRHTYITSLVESGMNLSIVKILAGHAHISTTQLYVNLTDDFVADSLKEYWRQKGIVTNE